MVRYSIDGTRVGVSEVIFSPIEFLDWDCLTVGALGWGQIQIANSKDVRLLDKFSRKQWMLQLCDVMAEFYPREITKTRDRISRFEAVRSYWELKEERAPLFRTVFQSSISDGPCGFMIMLPG